MDGLRNNHSILKEFSPAKQQYRTIEVQNEPALKKRRLTMGLYER
jgi:hypothetical protein